MKNNVFNFNSRDSELKAVRLNKKKIFLLILIILLVIAVISVLVIYSLNEDFRNFWDYTVLRKEVESSDVKSISLNKDNLSFAYSYDKIC